MNRLSKFPHFDKKDEKDTINATGSPQNALTKPYKPVAANFPFANVLFCWHCSIKKNKGTD